MTAIDPATTIGELVAQQPARSRAFEKFGIDYCCGGKKTLRQACADKGIDPNSVINALAQQDAVSGPAQVTPATMTLTQLADHVETTHHAYLKEELPRLAMLLGRIASAHGPGDERLYDLANIYSQMREELEQHMFKEERVLFPMIRQLDVSSEAPAFHCGSLANPISVMEHEHDDAGQAIESMRQLTNGYETPEWACNTYRAGMEALARFERDMHEHVHKENSILFPRALQKQQELSTHDRGAQ